MERPIVQREEMEASRIGGDKMVEEELKALRIQGWHFQKEALAGEGFDRSVQIETLEVIRRGQKWLDPTSSDATAHDRQQATAAFVLDPQPPLPVALPLGAGYTRSELGVERGLELDPVLGLFFGWERRGAFSFAFNLYRTSLWTVL